MSGRIPKPDGFRTLTGAEIRETSGFPESQLSPTTMRRIQKGARRFALLTESPSCAPFHPAFRAAGKKGSKNG